MKRSYYQKVSAVLISFIALGIGAARAEYVFTTESVMEGGYDYSQSSYKEVYDPDLGKEVPVFYNHEIAGAEVNDTDLVLDDEGKVHGVVNISKIGLQYLTNQSGVWVFETLLGDSATLSGPQVFIERDSRGYLHVLYNAQADGIHYFTNYSGKWKSYEIESSVEKTSVADFTIDQSDNLHFAYRDEVSDLVYGKIENFANRSSSGPKMGAVLKLDATFKTLATAEIDEEGDADAETFLDVKIETWDDRPYVAYQKSVNYPDGGIYLVNQVIGVKWDASAVISGTFGHCLQDIAFDEDGSLNLWSSHGSDPSETYRHVRTSFLGRFKSWSMEVIDLSAMHDYIDASFDFHPLSDGTVIGSWCWSNGKGCELVSIKNGHQTRQTIDTEGTYTSKSAIATALHKNGQPHMLYVDKAEPTYLKYAYAHDTEAVDFNRISEVAVATDSEGSALLAYYQQDAASAESYGDLKLATRQPDGTFSVETLDQTGDTGLRPDIAVNADHAYISYYYETDNLGFLQAKLKLATNCSGSWKSEIVAGSGMSSHESGEYSAIAVNDEGIHIAFYDADDGALLYATKPSCSSSSWTTETIDATSGADVGQNVNMALDADGGLHLSYYDATNGHLKYARGNSGAWTVKTLDSTDENGAHNDIAVDSQGYVHISYFSETDRALKYIHNVPAMGIKYTHPGLATGWKRKALVDSEHAGRYNSIAMNSEDVPHISYYSTTSSSLMLATQKEEEWVTLDLMTLDGGSAGRDSAIAIDAFDLVHVAHIVREGTIVDDLYYLQF